MTGERRSPRRAPGAKGDTAASQCLFNPTTAPGDDAEIARLEQDPEWVSFMEYATEYLREHGATADSELFAMYQAYHRGYIAATLDAGAVFWSQPGRWYMGHTTGRFHAPGEPC